MMANFTETIQKYRAFFLKTDPSTIPEIVAIFIGGRRLYTQISSPVGFSYDAVVIVESKADLYLLSSDIAKRQPLLNMFGIVREERSNFHASVPPPPSPAFPLYDGVQILGYDVVSAKRSVKILSLESFTLSKTSINILSPKDKRVWEGIHLGPVSMKILEPAITLGRYQLLCGQVAHASQINGQKLGAFGPTADSIVSGACIYGEAHHGHKIKKILVNHYESITGFAPSAKSFGRYVRFSPDYVNWLSRELAELRPISQVTFNPSTEGLRDHVFLLGEAIVTRASINMIHPTYTTRLSEEDVMLFNGGYIFRLDGHQPEFSHSSTSFVVRTMPEDGDDIDIFVKLFPYAQDELAGAEKAVLGFPRTTIPRLGNSGELLYPYFKGEVQSESRLTYIRGGRQDIVLAATLLHVELVKAEDTLRAYQRTLALQLPTPGQDTRYNIQRFFHDNLINDQRIRQLYPEGIILKGEAISLSRLLSFRWVINGKEYPTLREACDTANRILSTGSAQMSSCPEALGLGDSHGGNVMFDKLDLQEGGTSDVLFIDYEVAGVHPIMLDLAKPLYHDVLFQTLFQDRAPENIKHMLVYNIHHETNTIVVTFRPDIDSLTQTILDIKLQYLIKPLINEVRRLGVSLQDFVPLLGAALFVCAMLAKGFQNNEELFLSNYVTGLMLLNVRDWPEFLAQLVELGFQLPEGIVNDLTTDAHAM